MNIKILKTSANTSGTRNFSVFCCHFSTTLDRKYEFEPSETELLRPLVFNTLVQVLVPFLMLSFYRI